MSGTQTQPRYLRFIPTLTCASVNRSDGWANGWLVLSRATGLASDETLPTQVTRSAEI
ncbi:hypothetical protein [Marinimicrobium locisalis]|uniref:hypothetical protein n=1 Tax=Marinimicrobium locisalis TaxID=546022 RepID=UPI003221EEDD